MANNVDLFLRVLGQDRTGPAMQSAAKNVSGLDKASEKAAKSTKDLRDEFGQVVKTSPAVEKSAKAIKVAFAGLAVGAAAGAVTFFKRSVSAASDLEQSMGALNAVFGDNTEAMTKNARAAAKTGLSQAKYAQSAAVLGAQLGNLGVSQDQLVDTTDGLMTKAADMAAQFGGTTADAVDALGALFRGERDPIERYGVSITDAGIKAEMAATGLDKTQATMSLLNRQLEQSNTVGAAAREMDTLAGSTGRMQAEMENAAASLGSTQLPVFAKLADMVGKLAPELATALTPAFEALGDMALDALTGIEANLPKIRDGIADMGEKMGEIVPMVERNWPTIVSTFDNVGAALERVGGFLQATWDAFKSLPPEVQQVLALLAVAQKTGVINVAFKGAELVKGLVSNINANIVNVNSVGGAGAPSAAGRAAIGGLALGGIAAGATAGAIGAARGSARAGEQGANRGFIAGAPVPGAGGMWVDPIPQQGTPDAIERRLKKETDEVKSRASWMPSWLYEVVWQEKKPGAQFQPSKEHGWEPLKEGTAAANESIQKLNRSAAEGKQPLDNLGNSASWAGEVNSGMSEKIKAATRIVSTAFGQMYDDVKERIYQILQSVDNVFQSIGYRIQDSVSGAWRIVKLQFTRMKDDAIGAVQGLWTGVTDWFGNLKDETGRIFEGMVENIGRIWNRVTAVVKSPIASMFDWINRNMIDKINGVLGAFSDSVKLSRLDVPRFADGGKVRGPGTGRSDSILARVSNGEYVMPADATAKNEPVLDAMRNGAVIRQAQDAAELGFGIGPVGVISDVWSGIQDVLAKGASAALGFVANPALNLLDRLFGGEWSPDVVIGGMRNVVTQVDKWAKREDASVTGEYTGPRGPIQRPLNSYVVTSEWMRSGADPRHMGIDLGAPLGSPIFAAANGKAIPTTGVGWNGGYGTMATLDHGNGLKTLYAHMNSLAITVGKVVRAGQQIGTVGSTGQSTGPHVHFETWRGGRPVDPRSVLEFDSGGYLPPGVSVAVNKTNAPEPILTQEQWKALTESRSTDSTQVQVVIDGRVLHESLVRYKREQGGAALGLA